MTSTLPPVNPSGIPHMTHAAMTHIRNGADATPRPRTAIGDLGFVVEFTVTEDLRALDTWEFRHYRNGETFYAVVAYTRAGFIDLPHSSYFRTFTEACERAGA